jgi:hypothetical protein
VSAHDFEQVSATRVDDLENRSGILRQTLLWQSPASAEFGSAGAGDLREEPQPEQLFGRVRLFVDYDAERDCYQTTNYASFRTPPRLPAVRATGMPSSFPPAI